MRDALCRALVSRAVDERVVFLTGDLGFMALEPLRDVLGERFVNAGIAEQNMVTVAAALAMQHYEVWVYSIAPFCYARPFEQIRNDVALHGLPVKLVGNGAGYGYGVMGPTHHAIEDYGVLLTLQNLVVYAPAFETDVDAVVTRAAMSADPSYLRLGRDETAASFEAPAYAPWRQLTSGGGMTGIAFGAIAGAYVEAFSRIAKERRPNLWVLAELPLRRHALPEALLEQITAGPGVCTIEEHVRDGGLASQLACELLERGLAPRRFISLHARAHRFERYGSQRYLRRESKLDPESVVEALSL